MPQWAIVVIVGVVVATGGGMLKLLWSINTQLATLAVTVVGHNRDIVALTATVDHHDRDIDALTAMAWPHQNEHRSRRN
jgi:hypothetical protein